MYQYFFKRCFDIVLSLLALICISPILIVFSILLYFANNGAGVFFCQPRPGYKGKIFKVIKFKTMNDNKGPDGNLLPDTQRITRIGKFVRNSSIDELPQFFNVLKGDMSFVGPRPDVPGYADQLKGKDRDILKLKPGITGPASLKYRNEEELLASVDNPTQYNDEIIFPDKVKLNLYYLRNYSFIKDIQMIICTVLGKKMNYAGEII